MKNKEYYKNYPIETTCNNCDNYETCVNFMGSDLKYNGQKICKNFGKDENNGNKKSINM